MRLACVRLYPCVLSPLALAAGLALSCSGGAETAPAPAPPAETSLLRPEETHLRNLRQLTFGGEHAEAYFSADGRQLIFQSKRDGLEDLLAAKSSPVTCTHTIQVLRDAMLSPTK